MAFDVVDERLMGSPRGRPGPRPRGGRRPRRQYKTLYAGPSLHPVDLAGAEPVFASDGALVRIRDGRAEPLLPDRKLFVPEILAPSRSAASDGRGLRITSAPSDWSDARWLDRRSGTLRALVPPGLKVAHAAASPDGERIAVLTYNPQAGEVATEATGLHIVEAASGAMTDLPAGGYRLRQVSWLDTETLLASAILGGQVKGRWLVDVGRRQGRLMPLALALQLTPDGQWLLLGDEAPRRRPGVSILVHDGAAATGTDERWLVRAA